MSPATGGSKISYVGYCPVPAAGGFLSGSCSLSRPVSAQLDEGLASRRAKAAPVGYSSISQSSYDHRGI